jgi:hypothetical protein
LPNLKRFSTRPRPNDWPVLEDELFMYVVEADGDLARFHARLPAGLLSVEEWVRPASDIGVSLETSVLLPVFLLPRITSVTVFDYGFADCEPAELAKWRNKSTVTTLRLEDSRESRIGTEALFDLCPGLIEFSLADERAHNSLENNPWDADMTTPAQIREMLEASTGTLERLYFKPFNYQIAGDIRDGPSHSDSYFGPLSSFTALEHLDICLTNLLEPTVDPANLGSIEPVKEPIWDNAIPPNLRHLRLSFEYYPSTMRSLLLDLVSRKERGLTPYLAFLYLHHFPVDAALEEACKRQNIKLEWTN